MSYGRNDTLTTPHLISYALQQGNVISIWHKPDPNKGGQMYEGSPYHFHGIRVIDGIVSFLWIDKKDKSFPLTEIKQVITERPLSRRELPPMAQEEFDAR